MIGAKVKITTDVGLVAEAAKRANFTSLSKAAAVVRKIAMGMIKKSPKSEPAAAGEPPRTREGQLKKSIAYATDDRTSFFVGPKRSDIATIGAVHEFGLTYQGRPYPKRPFMSRALGKVRDRLPEFWRGSIQ